MAAELRPAISAGFLFCLGFFVPKEPKQPGENPSSLAWQKVFPALSLEMKIVQAWLKL